MEVEQVQVLLSDGRREMATKLFFLDAMPYRSPRAKRVAKPSFLAAYGMERAALAETAAPELALLRRGSIPGQSWGALA
jgi:hypothetical protein